MTRKEAWDYLVLAIEEGMRNCEDDASNGVEGAQETYDNYCEAFYSFLANFQEDLGL